jgi:hypothetical protein
MERAAVIGFGVDQHERRVELQRREQQRVHLLTRQRRFAAMREHGKRVGVEVHRVAGRQLPAGIPDPVDAVRR